MATRKSNSKRIKGRAKSQPELSRAKIIWMSLVASMTVIGGVLYALDPSAKDANAQPLMKADRTAPARGLKDARDGWTRIVLVDTGSPFAQAETLNEQALKLGAEGGVGYHFVIGNGNSLDDGWAFECPNWTNQKPASPVYAPGAVDGRTLLIGIVGNTRRDSVTPAQAERIRELVDNLMRRFSIPFDQVDFSRLGAGFNSAGFREAFGG